MKIRKIITTLAITLILATVTSSNAFAQPFKGNIERLEGPNRIETSIEISKHVYPQGTKNVIIVGYNGSIDALSGTLIAHDKNAPVLMTNQNKLTDTTRNEIKRLNANNAYVLGAESVVSEKVVKDLQSMGLTVKRLAGDDRAQTTVEIAKEVKGANADHVFLVLGWPLGEIPSLADALAIGPVSGTRGYPILLTKSDSIPKSTEQALVDLNVKNITIIGGVGPVSKNIENKLKEKYNVDRISGDNREATAIAISNKYFNGTKEFILSNGYASIDALLGGYMGAKNNTPIIFSNSKSIASATQEFLYKTSLDNGYVLGGPDVLSEDVRETAMNQAMKISDSNTKKPINVETPAPFASKNGQTTHPDVTYIEEGWNGHKYWMAHTPYNNSNEDLENPAVSYSDDGVNFFTYKGSVNPIDDPKLGLVDHKAHMSDTDMLIKPDGTMEVYYRYRDRAVGKGEIIYRKTSKDAINWSEREVVIKGFNDTGKNLLSPALMYENGQYRMWWVEETSVYTSTSKTALNNTWSKKQKVELNFNGKIMNPWHLDVIKDNDKYVLLLNVNESDIQSQRSLVLGESKNGLKFSNIRTIMRPTQNKWDNRDIYRGSIVNVNGKYKLYYSAMDKKGAWYIGLSESTDMNYWKGQY